MSDKTVLLDRIMSGTASDQDIEDYLGPEAVIRIGSSWRGLDHGRREASIWYREVLQPLGIDYDDAVDLYFGTISPAVFEDTLDESTKAQFIEKFPSLQEAFMTKYAWKFR